MLGGRWKSFCVTNYLLVLLRTFVLLLILKIYPSFRSDYLFMNNSGFFFTDAVLG
jgi:hypothetical protein